MISRDIVTTIASKDLRLFTTKTVVRLSIILFPLVAAIGFSEVLTFAGDRGGGIPVTVLPHLLDAFLFFFVIGAALLPTSIASYSLVGEKLERSLEPLLATPATDDEILLGKSLAAIVPPVVALWAGAVLFMVLSDGSTRPRLGRSYFPNGTAMLIVLVLIPLAAAFSVELIVLISARVSDLRAAQQLGALAVVPLAVVYVSAELDVVTLDAPTLAVISGVLVLVDVGLFVIARTVFRREEILTGWR